MKKSILIISYIFPPTTGIGGRRWAKFAKYFQQNNAEVNVISVKSSSQYSEWKSDVECLKDKTKFIHSNYPKILSSTSRSILARIYYRLAVFYVKLRVKGNYFDKFSLSRRLLLRETETAIKRYKVTHLIVTVAPFHGAYFVSQLISKYPDIIFIVDYRDPWLYNKTAYGFESLSAKRKTFEIEAERKVVEKFNYVISVSEYMTESFKKYYTQINSDKFLTFENGYDPQDGEIQLDDPLFSNNEINIVFTGTLYNNSNRAIEILRKVMLEFKRNSGMKNNIRWHFLGDVKKETIASLVLCGEVVFYGKVEKSKALGAISKADVCLLILSDDIDYSFSTKFCEYVWFKKPILVIADSRSPTGRYVFNNRIGFHLHEGVSLEEFSDFFGEVKKLQLYRDFDLSYFSVQEIAKRYFEFIKNASKTRSTPIFTN